MKLIIAVLFLMPLLASSQNIVNRNIKDTGPSNVNWSGELSWDQVKAKANKENKYIFLDCYATWCMPCKKMDKEVYPNDSISTILNSNFIAVRVQMDTSKNDDERTRKWYEDARNINQLYNVNSYPAFLFFSPGGELVHKGIGYKDVQEFVALMDDAVNPDKQFYTLLKKYRGEKDYSKAPYLAYKAYDLENKNTSILIAKDYIDNYLLHLKDIELFTKDNIQFISGFTTLSKDKGFRLFYKNTDKINKLMGDSTYVQSVLHYVISMEEVQPALTAASKSTISTPDWLKLSHVIRKKYNSYYADRVIIEAKVRWYRHKHKWPELSKNIISFVEKYVSYSNDGELTDRSWDIFLYSMDKKELETALEWTKRVIKRSKDSTNILPNIMDTYANLIYKISYVFNDKKETKNAIEEEEQALGIAVRFNDKSKVKTFSKVIEKMKRGEPTWPQM